MIERAVTLFPQPDSPTTPRIVPGSIANETSSTAATGPSSNMNSVRRFWISSRGCTIRISLPRLSRSFRFDPDAPQIVPGGRGTNSPDSLLHRVKRGPDRNEIVDLIVVKQSVQRSVHLDPPPIIEGLPSLDEQAVYLRIGVGNEIRCLALAGVEDGIIVLFEVGVYPKQKRRVELVPEHSLGEARKLDLLHVHLDAQFLYSTCRTAAIFPIRTECALISSVKWKGNPSLSRIPSPLVSAHPAWLSSLLARSGLYSSRITSGSQ